ncbi:MAG TPA: PAS domain S-box protein, partial [Gallionella sp.]|nr:PAS domain S-box protein [Gallionella sp.]
TRWMSQRNSPIKSSDGTGTTLAILGVVTDVTERKLAEGKRIQLSEALKQTQEAVALADQNNCFTYVNPAYVRLFGYTEEELMGRPVNDVMGGMETTVQPYRALATSSERGVFRGEVIRRAKDGRIVPVLLSVASIKNEYGKTTGYVANITDLSERKRAEETLQKQKEFMWQVLDTDPNLIFVKNAEGRFILVNKAMADACGRTVQEMIWKKNAEVYPDQPLEVAGFLAADRDVIQERREVVLTESAKLPDGRQRWYLTIKRPMIEDNGAVSVLGIAMDITEQRQSEMKLALSYKELQRLSSHLENALEDERTRIARELHDEMGATLAAMKMRLAWLASRLPLQMRHLAEETEHISELVSDGIQTVRQIVHKLRPSLLEDVGLVAAIEDYVKKFRQHTGIECMLSLPGQEFVPEQGQAATLFRILQESLSNVAKHAQASRVDVILTKRGKSLLLVVEDNGIGFELGRKEKSFGLLGIRERALMAGGKARISSEPGKGARISISIPAILALSKAG